MAGRTSEAEATPFSEVVTLFGSEGVWDMRITSLTAVIVSSKVVFLKHFTEPFHSHEVIRRRTNSTE